MDTEATKTAEFDKPQANKVDTQTVISNDEDDHTSQESTISDVDASGS